MNFFGRALILCVLVLAAPLAVSPVLAAGAPVMAAAGAGEPERAAGLLKTGRAEEAYRLYSRLLRETPDDDAVNLGLFNAALATNRVPQALFVLERLVDRYPADTALRMRLVRLYVDAGDEESAGAELERARRFDASLSLDDAERALDSLRREKAQRTSLWRAAGRVTVGIMYDSNVNSGLFGRSLRLGWLDLLMDEETVRHEAWGEYANVALHLARRTGPGSPWWVVGDVGTYVKHYNRSVPSNRNFQWGRAGLGLRRVDSSSLAELRLKAEHAAYDPYRTVDAFGPELTLAYSLSPRWQTISSGRVEHRAYRDGRERDGTYWSLGQTVRLLFGGDRGHEATAGLRWIGADTGAPAYDYRGWEASARLVLRPWARLDVSPFILWREEDRRGTATTLEKVFGAPERKDDILQTGVFFFWHWNKHWSQELGYQYVNNRSNSPFYTYAQHVFNMGLTWSF